MIDQHGKDGKAEQSVNKSVGKKLCELYGDVKESFSLEYITNLSSGQAIGEFLKLAFAPMYLTFFLGLFTLLADKQWNGVFLNAIDEFMQLTGLKLCLYILLFVFGFSLLFYRWERLTSFFAVVIRTLSHTGFAISAILAGVMIGIAVPASIDANRIGPLGASLTIALGMAALATIFYYSVKLFCSNLRSEIDSAFGEHTSKVTAIIGVIVIGVAFNSMFIEEKWDREREQVTACDSKTGV
ncbi:hypothetical protein AAEU31_12865 [Pseudoalteromonas sp. SSMSWG5]|uniref:hypothetical protein n=1 Tax=Pseudoalteromonas sp. SSMSWG5 TaxID=3139396 RepID=UPI003BAB17D1